MITGMNNIVGYEAKWGAITGTLSEQTDLQNALNACKYPYYKELSTGSGTTCAFTFSEAHARTFAFIFGRNGYNSANMTAAIISLPSEGNAYVQNLTSNTISVSATGKQVIITTQSTYAYLWVMSYTPIS